MVKSIVDIQVNDQAFRNFQQAFRQYQNQLKATPLSWRQIAIAQQQGIKGFRDLVAEEVAAIGKAKMLAEVHAKAVQLTRSNADVWRDMARNTRRVVGDIKDMTGQLFRWTSLTTIFSGLIGAGGLFGIARMAQNTADQRRQSMGVGTGYGDHRAFGSAFGRLTDPDQFLGNIDTALRSAAGKASLYGAGLKKDDLQGSTSDVAVRFLRRARELARSSRPEFDLETMRARGIDQHISLQDFQRLRSTGNEEFNSLLGRFSRNRGAFGVSEKDQRAYQDFMTTLDEAQNKISAVFVRGVAPLIPGLEKLSTSAAEVVKTFLEAPKLKEWMDGAGKGLKEFAEYVGTDEFQNKVRQFVVSLGIIAEKTIAFAQWLAGSKAVAVAGGVASAVTTSPYAPSTAKRDMWGGLIDESNVKPGAGTQSETTSRLKGILSSSVPGIKQFTAFNDHFHGGTGGHGEGRALDLTLQDGSLENYARTAKKIREELAARGIAATVLDEANYPSARSTAPHLHVEAKRGVDLTLMNATGGSVVVAGGQLGAGGTGQ